MTSASIEQKVRQLDNDVHAIYEMLSTIESTQRRHTNRFAEIGQDLSALGSRMDQIESKVDAVDTSVHSLDTRLGSLDTKLDLVLELLQR